MQDHTLLGLPDWTKHDQFDIIARAAQDIALTGDPSTPSPVFLMLQSLLRERFQLAARTERREMPIYALAMLRPDGTLGPRFTQSTTDCRAVLAALREKAKSCGAPPSPSDRVQCGSRFRPEYLAGGAVELDGGEFSLTMTLSRLTGRTVVSRTGLTGVFDCTLEFAPEPSGSPPTADVGPGDLAAEQISPGRD